MCIGLLFSLSSFWAGLGPATLHHHKPDKAPGQSRKRKEKTQKDCASAHFPRVKVASQFLKRLGKLKVEAKQNTHMHQSNPITAFSKTHNHSLLLTMRKIIIKAPNIPWS